MKNDRLTENELSLIESAMKVDRKRFVVLNPYKAILMVNELCRKFIKENNQIRILITYPDGETSMYLRFLANDIIKNAKCTSFNNLFCCAEEFDVVIACNPYDKQIIEFYQPIYNLNQFREKKGVKIYDFTTSFSYEIQNELTYTIYTMLNKRFRLIHLDSIDEQQRLFTDQNYSFIKKIFDEYIDVDNDDLNIVECRNFVNRIEKSNSKSIRERLAKLESIIKRSSHSNKIDIVCYDSINSNEFWGRRKNYFSDEKIESLLLKRLNRIGISDDEIVVINNHSIFDNVDIDNYNDIRDNTKVIIIKSKYLEVLQPFTDRVRNIINLSTKPIMYVNSLYDIISLECRLMKDSKGKCYFFPIGKVDPILRGPAISPDKEVEKKVLSDKFSNIIEFNELVHKISGNMI